MNRHLCIAAALFAASLCAFTAAAADPSCLSKEQRRAVMASGKVISLSQAIHAAKARKNEILRASLCRDDDGLVYLLTVLRRDGKVMRMTVDAESGRLADG